MADMSDEIDATLVPGMMTLNVQEALDKAASLCVEMRESADYCTRLLDRLGFLRDELPKQKNTMSGATEYAKVTVQFAITIGLVVHFLKKYSEKKLLQRIAANRLITEEVERLHNKIDNVFSSAALANSPRMNEWKEQKASDLIVLRHKIQKLVQNPVNLVSGLSESSFEEARTELQFEIESCRDPEIKALLSTVLLAVLSDGVEIPNIPSWFVCRDAIEIEDQPFDMGAFGVVHKGIWDNKDVCVKQLFMDGADTQKDFLRETAVWHGLSHEHVIKMHGGCHVGKPLFFVSEFAQHGNFVDFLDRAENKSKLWRLFLQAAKGLAYLHSKRIIHSDIKCNNILVGTGDDGNGEIAKFCDFGYSHIRTLSLGKSIKELPSSARWKAPECLLQQGVAANPTFKSDIFSFGMTIIEAKIGGVPWGIQSDDDIMDQYEAKVGYPRPDGVFTDMEWGLVQGLTALNPGTRMSLPQAIGILEELAEDQEAREKHNEQILKDLEIAQQKEPKPVETVLLQQTIRCWSCHKDTPAVNRFCGECGVPLEHLERMPASVVFASLPSDPAPHLTSNQEKGHEIRRDSSQLMVELKHFLAKVTSDKPQQSWLTEFAALVYLAHEQNTNTASAGDWVVHILRAVEEIHLKLERMCLEMRENGQMLKTLVAGLIRVLKAIACDAVQPTEADATCLSELYAGLLVLLEQLSSAPTNIFYRIASSRHVLHELDMLREKVFILGHLASASESQEIDSNDTWIEHQLTREAQMVAQLEQTHDLSEVLPDHISQIEALVTLKHELKIVPDQDLISTAYNKVSEWFKTADVRVPDWFIPRYEVIFDSSSQVTGDGTFGTVYHGRWRTYRTELYGSWRTRVRSVTVKVLLMYGLGGELAQASFLKDIKHWYDLQDHPNVLKLYGASHVGQRAFLVLEHDEHRSVLSFLDDMSNRSKVWQLMYQAAQGLSYLHKNGIIHGHLRCSNILISGDGAAKITDFGLGGIRNAIKALAHNTARDPLQWTAPELLLNEDEVPTSSSDVYSLGMCVIEALNRSLPWGEYADSDLLKKIERRELLTRPADTPDKIWDLVMKMCAYEPSGRPSLEEVVLELERLTRE